MHLDSVRESFSGKLVTQWHPGRGDKREQWDFAQANGIEAVQGADRRGLGRDMLHFNSNSGAQAINYAYLLGAGRIILLGYDMQHTGGKAHFFGNHPNQLAFANHAVYIETFTQVAKDLQAEGVDVINCSRETALTQFRRAALENICP